MSFLRVLFYPVKALGSVTINGYVITRGETIQQFGELKIDLGTYRQDDIVLYNEGQQWTPVSIEGNILVYSLMSNGNFFIYDNARKIVFDFTNNMQQDFTIDRICDYNLSTPDMPGTVIRKGSYRQEATWRKSTGAMQTWVISTGNKIDTLELTCTNGEAKFLTKASELGDDTVRVILSLVTAETGKPSSIYLGDVLIVYVEDIIA